MREAVSEDEVDSDRGGHPASASGLRVPTNR